MTPAQREKRRQRELEAIFQAGWDNAATMPPLTERQIERLAFLIAPALRASTAKTALPQAA